VQDSNLRPRDYESPNLWVDPYSGVLIESIKINMLLNAAVQHVLIDLPPF